MKIFSAILFLCLYLFSSTELGELVKLPMLVHHYLEHRGENRHLSVVDFWNTHFNRLHKAAGVHHEQDHRQLPFKEHDHPFLTASVSTAPVYYTFAAPPVHRNTRSGPCLKNTRYRSHYFADIWQPPRASVSQAPSIV